MKPTEEEKSTCCCKFWRGRKKNDEANPLLNDKARTTYGKDTVDKVNGEQKPTPNSTKDEPTDETKRTGSVKVEEIKMKPLNIKKVDDIFKKFEETFNLFTGAQKSLANAVKEFKATVKTTGEFKECLMEFKRQLNNEVIVMKKLSLKIPKAIAKGGGTLGNAATALTKILEAYVTMENLPVKVTDKCIICIKKIMELDPTEVMSEEFSGSVFDLGKIPKQMTNIRDNLKEIKKAPGIVKSFFQYSTAIVMEMADAFGNEKTKEDITSRKAKADRQLATSESNREAVENPKPPKEIDFKSLKIPSLDRLFTDISKLINPVAKLSKDLYESRNNLEKAMKAISKFREDEAKAFNDYLDELKERIRKGDVHISVRVQGNHVEVTKVEGFEPNVMRNIQSGLKGVLKSGSEIEDLGPETFKELIKLLGDVTKISTSDIKAHVSFKEIVPTVSALNENTQKAKEIPGILKFFLTFVRNLLMDILDVVHVKDEKPESPGGEKSDGNEGDEDRQ